MSKQKLSGILLQFRMVALQLAGACVQILCMFCLCHHLPTGQEGNGSFVRSGPTMSEETWNVRNPSPYGPTRDWHASDCQRTDVDVQVTHFEPFFVFLLYIRYCKRVPLCAKYFANFG